MNSDDEESRFVQKRLIKEARLQGECDALDKRIRKLQNAKDDLKAKARELDDDIRRFENNNQRLSLYYERNRAVQMSPVWVAIVFLTAFCKYSTWTRGSFFFMLLNEFAFLLNWRGLYVARNFYFSVVALLLAIFTFVIVK